MRLKELLRGIYQGKIREEHKDYFINSISQDSRTCEEGSLFIALKGISQNGVDYIPQAVRNGAVCVVHQGKESLFLSPEICVLRVDCLKEFLFLLTNRFYNDSASKVECIGITGTNGKTTTAYLIESILNCAQRKCGVIGTINCHFENHKKELSNTTPNLIETISLLDQMRQFGISYCAIEVSSHALDQGRLKGLPFKAGIFTNLSQDHLDYHQTMENYFLAKVKLFDTLSSKNFAIINTDDYYGRMLEKKTSAKIIRYGIKRKSDVSARRITMNISGCEFILQDRGYDYEIASSLVGEHNVYNILAAISVCRCLGVTFDKIQEGVRNLKFIPGRLERISTKKKFHIFVDYAHTDDALRSILTYLRDIARSRVLLVFGCGGNRDKGKRMLMGQVADRLADFTIITSDNPRDEDPDRIIEEVVSGFKQKNYLIMADRKEAIRQALLLAKDDDIVLVAGKGHESYQIIKDRKNYFNDRLAIEEISSCLE